MQSKLSIAFVCNEYPPAPHGGVGTFTQLVARSLAATGCEVRVIGLYAAGCEASQYEVDEGVHVFRHRYPARDLLSMRARMLLFRQIKSWAEAGAIDLVEAPDCEGWAAGWPKLPVPVVARVHGSGSYFGAELGRPRTMESRILFLIERTSMRRADYWCSVSRYAAEKTRQIFRIGAADAVTYNPVLPEPLASFQERSPGVVVFTGTLTPKKGIYSLVAAWPSVLARRSDAELHVYGKDLRRNGRSISESLLQTVPAEARSSIVFHGHQPRPAVIESLRTARVAVFPSYAEAFAFAPLEAMSCGCPTIYSQRCSGPELIDDGKDGLLIDPDDGEGVADAIVRILNDDSFAQRLSDGGAAKIRAHFTMELLLPQISGFYERCVAEFAARRPVPARARAATRIVV